MAGASIFVYPSLDEGFGLPVLNAMAAGTPVLTSNRGSLPEICGDAALLIEPDHLESITEGLRCLMSDPGRREMMKQKGQKQAAQFTWAETARQTAQAYEAVLRTLT